MPLSDDTTQPPNDNINSLKTALDNVILYSVAIKQLAMRSLENVNSVADYYVYNHERSGSPQQKHKHNLDLSKECLWLVYRPQRHFHSFIRVFIKHLFGGGAIQRGSRRQHVHFGSTFKI